MLYPDLIRKNEYFKEFKDYHDQQYKISKGEKKIWVELALFVTTFSIMMFSFYKVTNTNAGEVADNDIWKVHLPEELTESQKAEYLTLLFERREEILLANKNIILKNSPDTSNFNYCKYIY